MALASVFFDVPAPTPATWLYFSAPLAVALFFLFTRLFCIRNLDVLTLYLFAPGLLMLGEPSSLVQFWGYVWLLGASLYFLLRCLADLANVRRPALGVNLNLSGLGWLAGSLFVALIATAAAPTPPERYAARPPARPTDPVGEAGQAALAPVAPAKPLRLLAVLCHLSVAVGLTLIGWRHFDDVRAGLSAATFYLLLPYTFLLLPDSPTGVGRWDHPWPMALVVWTIFAYRRPVLAGAFLGVAAATSPILLCIVPAWVSLYRGRGMARFLLGFFVLAALSGAVLGLLLWYYYGKQPPPLLQPTWANFDWQPWKEPQIPFEGLWKGVHAAYRAPVFIASLALIVTSAFWPNPKNLAHVLALSAAALLSTQFWYADRGGTHVLWFLPLLLLLVFRPNLSSSEPPTPRPGDWLARLWQGLTGRLMRLLRLRRAAPEKATA